MSLNRICVLVVMMLSAAAEGVFAQPVRPGVTAPAPSTGIDTSQEAVHARVKADISFLAADRLEGRGIDTQGIETAAKYILSEFQKAGLQPAASSGNWRQPFPVAMGSTTPGDSAYAAMIAPDGSVRSLQVKDEFQPLRAGAVGTASGELVFAGYGIRSEEDNYDDYRNVDVRDRIVVILRREPRQDVPDGAFQGTATSQHSYIENKIRKAADLGAAAIIMVNDPHSAPDSAHDELMSSSGFGTDGETIPFVHVRQSVIDDILRSVPLRGAGGEVLSSLRSAAEHIDRTLQPISQPLQGWTAKVTTDFVSDHVTAENLMGVIEGEGPDAHETIIIGAHYDHIGYGGFGARDPRREGEIHNGADDNASGTSAVLELARQAAAGPRPGRRLLFICFSAEEKGLHGSNYYVRHPVFPLENTVFMLNFDMIGHLRNNQVEVNGTGTAKELTEIARRADQLHPLDIRIVADPFGGSDHLPFYKKGIPVVLMFTGMTGNYHTPEDDTETLNLSGVANVIDYSRLLLNMVTQHEMRLTFQEVSRSRTNVMKTPFLGVAPELSDTDTQGILVRAVTPGSPAAAAGIQVGDVLVKFGGRQLLVFQDLVDILSASAEGDQLDLTLKRNSALQEVKVRLGAARR